MRLGTTAPERDAGTRVALFPQYPGSAPATRPEVVRLSPPAGTVGPGPADDRIYVVDPVGKRLPYGFHRDRAGRVAHHRPPWQGAARPPAEPDGAGHFDHLDPRGRAFARAHAYGCVRFALDVWEGYFARRIPFHFERAYDRLEVVLLEGLDNALAGYGSIELGAYRHEGGRFLDFALSFDVIAHELGHLLVYSVVGLPDVAVADGEHFGFHESAADMVSLVALLHFETALDGLLAASRGNLYSFNRLNRFGEISAFEQLRLASNRSTLWDFERGWTSEHDLSEPLTAALFDIWVDLFHEALLDRGLLAGAIEDLSDRLEHEPDYEAVLQPLFDEAFADDPQGFAAALVAARDRMGALLARAWTDLAAVPSYAAVRDAMVRADAGLSGGRYRRIIAGAMARRGIGLVEAGPRLAPPASDSHAFSPRTEVPRRIGPAAGRRCMPYRVRMALARGG